MTEDTAADASASASTAQDAQLRSLRRQLDVLQRQQEHYRTHYGQLESVCWEVLDDVQELRRRTAGLNESHHMDASFTDASGVLGRGDSSSVLVSSASPVVGGTAAQASADLPPASAQSTATEKSFQHAASTCPRVCGAVHLQQGEAQALMERLWTLRMWVGDLAESVGSGVTNSAPPSGSSAPSQRDAQAVTPSKRHIASTTSTTTPNRPQTAQRMHAPTAGAASSSQRIAHRDPLDDLHALIDDVFLRFTQLQAALTDALWPLTHPPALSTPPHSRLDRDVEVARLRTINDQLRRTLQGYELAHRRSDERVGRAAVTGVRGGVRPAPQHRASVAATAAPPGYKAAASDAGLVIAHARRT